MCPIAQKQQKLDNTPKKIVFKEEIDLLELYTTIHRMHRLLPVCTVKRDGISKTLSAF